MFHTSLAYKVFHPSYRFQTTNESALFTFCRRPQFISTLVHVLVVMDQSTMPTNPDPVPESPSSVEILNVTPEKVVTPISPPPSSRNTSRESLPTPTKRHESPETPLHRIRRLTATPSTHASGSNPRRSMSGAPDLRREKSPISLSSLSDYDGSEASHTERRFLRLYEELEVHCSGANS